MEELGVDVKIIKIALEYKDDDNEIRCIVFFGEIAKQPKVMEPHACSQLQWFVIRNLKNIDLADFTRVDFEKLGWI